MEAVVEEGGVAEEDLHGDVELLHGGDAGRSDKDGSLGA